MQTKDIVTVREDVENAAAEPRSTWADAFRSLVEQQRKAQLHRVVTGAKFDAQDARLHILALEKIAEALCPLPKAEKRGPGRPKKVTPPVVVTMGAPQSAEDRVLQFSQTLCPDGWRDRERAAVAAMAESALEAFLKDADLAALDVNLAHYQELQLLLKKLDEAEAAGKRVVNTMLRMPARKMTA